MAAPAVPDSVAPLRPGGPSPASSPSGSPCGSPSDSPLRSPLQPGELRSAADLVLGRTLGAGSFSRVVLASRRDTGEAVAVKIGDLSTPTSPRRRAQRPDPVLERTLLTAAATHPSVVGFVAAWEQAGEAYLVMEACVGGPFLPAMRRFPAGAAQWAAAPRLIAQVTSGLEHLAALGIAHRDLKPDNLLLNVKSHVKIADFGSACWARDCVAAGFVGTPEYASPELLEQGHYTAVCSDLWALGCIVFEMYCGRPPFEGPGGEMELFERVKQGAVQWPTAEADLPAAARALIEALLAVAPADRLGARDGGGFADLRAHPYFSAVDWGKLHDVGEDLLCAPWPKRLTVVRHGESGHNVHYAQHCTDALDWDSELTAEGRRQAAALRGALPYAPDLVISSPLRRALATCLAAAPPAHYPGARYEVWAEARELLEAGCDIGSAPQELARLFPALAHAVAAAALDEVWWYSGGSVEGGVEGSRRAFREFGFYEPESELRRRCGDFARRIAGRAERDIVVFAHADWAHALLGGLGQGEVWLDNCECRVLHLVAEDMHVWERFLLSGESVVRAGHVTKTRYLSTKRRVLVLTDHPRLFYCDPTTQDVKGTVPWGAELRASVVSQARFKVHTPGRAYDFTDLREQAAEWAEAVNALAGRR